MKFDAEKLSIDEFKIIKGDIEASFDFDSNKIINYKTDMSFDVSFNLDAKMIKADIGFMIETNSDNAQDEVRANFDFVYVIHVENLENLVTLNKKKEIKNIENDLVISIAAITYSTSRGILMTRLQGTAMEDYILPIIQPTNLLLLDKK